jgi:hypothetical protein
MVKDSRHTMPVSLAATEAPMNLAENATTVTPIV